MLRASRRPGFAGTIVARILWPGGSRELGSRVKVDRIERAAKLLYLHLWDNSLNRMRGDATVADVPHRNRRGVL